MTRSKKSILILSSFLVFIRGFPPDGLAAQPLPDEIAFKRGYIASSLPPPGWLCGVAWFQALHDERLGPAESVVEIKNIRLSAAMSDGSEKLLRSDYQVWDERECGGLYSRKPWFGTDEHLPMPAELSGGVLRYRPSEAPDKVWHHWNSRRSTIPKGCTHLILRAEIRLSGAAIFQAGIDWWKTSNVGYGGYNVNNREAGCSDWYYPARAWQQLVFSTAIP